MLRGYVAINIADALACALKAASVGNGFRAGCDVQYAIDNYHRISDKEVRARAEILCDAVSKALRTKFSTSI